MSQNKSLYRYIRLGLMGTIGLLVSASLLGLTMRRTEATSKPVPNLRSPAPVALPANVLQGGSWSSIIQTTDVPVHMSLLPDGQLLYWGRDKASDGWDVQFQSKTFLWNPLYSYDPTTGNATASDTGATVGRDNLTTNLFCSGHSFLPDGTLLVAGGHQRHPDPNKANLEGIGEDDLNTFDYRSGTWTLLPTHMQWGRWYPRTLTLADGSTLILSGTYLPGPSSTATLNTTPDIFGNAGLLTQGAADPNVFGFQITSIYPFITLAPDARAYYAGAPDDSKARFFDVAANTWSRTLSDMEPHDTGTAITYAPGQFMVAGGRHSIITGPNHDTLRYVPWTRVQLMNLNLASGSTTPAWSDAQVMQNARNQMTGSVLLPDGKVLAVGGTKCPGTNAIKYSLFGEDDTLPPCDNGQVLTPELWTPGNATNPAGNWTQMAPHQETRVYHSTAVLLPDGRVMVAGGGLPVASGETFSGVFCYGANETSFTCKNSGHKTAEVFSPPYLFESDGAGGARLAVRPAITIAPASASYGQQFYVGVGNVAPTTANISKVVLVRLPSITHGSDPNQRRIELNYQPAGDNYGLTVTAPANGTICPPGPYMLFLIRNNGTPSFAKIMRIGDVSVSKAYYVFQSGTRNTSTTIVDSLSGSVNVTAPAGTSWTATVSSDATSWLTITSGSSGSGNGSVAFSVLKNSGLTRRIGTIFVKFTGRKYSDFQVRVGQAADFADVAKDSGFYPFIGNFFAREFTGGCDQSGNFCPSRTITNGEASVFLVSAMGLVPSLHTPQVPTFADVTPAHGFYRFIEAVARTGVMSGCGSNQFCPETPITRGQFAVALMKGIGVTNPPVPATQTFQDVPPSNPQYPYIEEMVRRGITGGCFNVGGVRKFCPDDSLTRSEVSVFISVAFKLWPQS